MKYLISFLLSLFIFISASAQFPGTDSLRNFNNKYIDNNANKAFTNLRLHNLLAGIIDFTDSAMLGVGGTIGIDTLWMVNDSLLTYRKNGVFRTFIIRGSQGAGSIYEVPYSDGAGRFTADPHFLFDKSQGAVLQRLIVGPGAINSGGLAKINATSDTMAALALTGFTNGSTAIILRKARGTIGTPLTLQVGDSIISFSGRGYTGTAWTGAQVGITGTATQNWTDTTLGTRLAFSTTSNDSANMYVRLAVSDSIQAQLVADATADSIVAVRDYGGGLSTLLKIPFSSTNFIQNQFASAQDGSFWIDSTGRVKYLNVDSFATFTPISAPAYTEGRIYYDDDTKSISVMDDISGTSIQLSQEQIIRARNNTGTTINDASAVYITGSIGTNPTIALAQANSVSTSAVIGLATHNIANNTTGKVVTFGVANDVNTSAFSEGAKLYLSATTPGGLTSTEPTAPDVSVFIGHCLTSHVTNGKILISTDESPNITASNGLTKTGSNIALGGTIDQVTAITSPGTFTERISISGTSGSGFAPIVLSDNGTGAALVALEDNNLGEAIAAQHNGTTGNAIISISNGGAAFAGTSSSGTTFAGTSQSGIPMSLAQSSNADSVTIGILLSRFNGSAPGGANLGSSILWRIEDNAGTGVTPDGAKISSYWTSAVAGAESSNIDFWTRGAGVFDNKFSIKGNGQLQATKYGINTFAGTPAYALGVDATGNLVEFAAGATPTWQQTLTAGSTLTTDNVITIGANSYRENATNDFGTSYFLIDEPNGFVQHVIKNPDNDSAMVRLSTEDGDISLFSDGGTTDTRSQIQAHILGTVNTAFSKITGSGAVISTDTSFMTVIANRYVGTVRGTNRFDVSADRISFDHDSSTDVEGDLNLYINKLPQSSDANDSILVRNAAGRIYTRGPGQTFAQTSTVTVAATTTETTLIGSGAGSLTIPSASWVAGKTYRIKIAGILGTATTDPGTTNFRLKLGSTTIATTGGIFQGTNITGRNFEITTEFTCRATGATGTVMTMGFYQDRNGSGNRMDDSGSGTPTVIDMTTNQTIDFTLQWSQVGSGGGGNTCSVYLLYLEAIN